MSATPAIDAEVPVDEKIALAELFRLRVRHWRTHLAGAALLTLTVAWVFDGHAVDRRMWLWAGAIWLICIAQVALCLWMERVPRDEALPPAWWHCTHFLAIGIGILWSSLAWLLPGDNATLQLLAAFASAMVVLASASASTSKSLLLAVVIPAMLLIPSTLILHSGIPVAGMVSVVLLVLILQHGLSLQRAMLESILLRHRAEELTEKLRVEQQKSQDVMRQQVMLDERQRMIRDLHDGLGSTLMSTLVALERGTMPPTDVPDVLRECIDDSRIVIDSLEPIGHDIVVLLATMRHRLGPRLQAAGLNVRWEVQDLPLLTWLGPPQALQVMRIVQEAFANVLKHARANSLRIATRQTMDACGIARVVIEIEDDGIGFDAVVNRNGRGLNHLKSRAQQLDATVEIVSAVSKGTRVTLTLPLSATIV